jgi:phosphohistidine phosphatase
MKHLVLMRHASARAGENDRERPLSPEGRSEALAGGRALAALAERGFRPDRALVSPARRARETFAALQETFGALAADEDEALYLASASRLLERLRALPESAEQVLVVGHNPGLADLARRLAGRANPDAQRAAARGLAPGAFAALRVPGGWLELARGGAELVAFVRPAAGH